MNDYVTSMCEEANVRHSLSRNRLSSAICLSLKSRNFVIRLSSFIWVKNSFSKKQMIFQRLIIFILTSVFAKNCVYVFPNVICVEKNGKNQEKILIKRPHGIRKENIRQKKLLNKITRPLMRFYWNKTVDNILRLFFSRRFYRIFFWALT